MKYLRQNKRTGIYEARMRVRPHDLVVYRSTGTRDKMVAQKLLDDWFRQMEREAYGVVSVARKEKAAAEKPLLKHLQTYLHEQSVLGLDDRYMLQIESQLKRLIEECGWQYIQHIDKASFNAWRADHGTLSPKTLNQYLGAITGLLKWLVENEHLKKNPLEGVRRVSSKKWEEDSPRALTEEEVEALLSVAGPRRAVYATAVLTGIRRGELKQLRVGDIVLDAPAPYILVRSSVAKNGKEESVELPAVLLDILREVKAGRSAGEKAFAFPTWKTFQSDLVRAGIAKRDEEGRKASFHSLRHTICTEGLKAGIAPRVMQKMMRHSDIRMTTEIYTDPSRLPVAAEVNRLPTYGLESAPRIAPRKSFSKGLFLSQTDKVEFLDALSKVLGIKEFRQGLSELVNDGEWWALQDSNL